MNWQEVVKSSETSWKPSGSSSNSFGSGFGSDGLDETSNQVTTSRFAIEINKKITHYWSKEDDRKLLKLASKHSQNWELIADKFKDKSASQLSNRWKNKLDPKLKKTSWNDEEETVLKMLVLQFGYEWEKISKYLQGRSPVEIKKRFSEAIFHTLTETEILALQSKIRAGSEENERPMDMDYKNQGNREEVLMALNRKVEDLHSVMRNTISQIQKLELNVFENQGLLSNN
jgi:hypothetical protein